MALFSTSRALPQTNHLVSFRAGKMTMRGTMVHPDKRKGLIYVYQSDDSLMHFCWKDRTTGSVEDDLIVFPEDIEFVPVKQCTTGRVFLLKFKNSSRKLFFWMQEPKNDKDDECCRKVNDLLNNPPAPGSARTMGSRGGTGASAGSQDPDFSMMNQLLNLGGGGGGSGSGSGGEERMDIQNVLAGMDQQQLMQLLNFVGGQGSGLSGIGLDSPSLLSGLSPAAPSTNSQSATPGVVPPVVSQSTASTTSATIPTTATASARATVPSSGATAAEATSASGGQKPIQVADLRNILSNLSGSGGSGGGSRDDVDLEDVLTAANVEKIATEKEGNLSRLLTHLPNESDVNPDAEEVKITLHSPQFKQALGVFSTALQSGQLGPTMRQFGFSDSAVKAVDKGDIQSIAEILESEHLQPSTTTSSSSTTGESSDASKTSKNDESTTSSKTMKSDKDKPDSEDPMDLD